MTSMSPTLRRRALTIGTTVSLAIVVTLAGPAPSGQASLSKPSNAQLATVGVQYFGNTDHCASGEPYVYCHADLWRLPALLPGDNVTVAWRHTTNDGPKMCITGNVDDFDFEANRCNRSKDQYNNEAVYGSISGKRTVFTVPASASPAYLTFYDNNCFGPCGNYGPYEFTVEKIQHRVLGAIPARNTIKRTATLTVRPGLTNGAKLVGAAFTLKIKVKGQKLRVRSARVTTAGTVSFKLALPKSAKKKKATFQLVRGATSSTLPFASAKTTIKVK
jgi:hypothetical protein